MGQFLVQMVHLTGMQGLRFTVQTVGIRYKGNRNREKGNFMKDIYSVSMLVKANSLMVQKMPIVSFTTGPL
jgi:hypothetical protein